MRAKPKSYFQKSLNPDPKSDTLNLFCDAKAKILNRVQLTLYPNLNPIPVSHFLSPKPSSPSFVHENPYALSPKPHSAYVLSPKSYTKNIVKHLFAAT